MNLKIIAITLAIAVGSAAPQSKTDPRSEFDVASVKPSRLARAGGEGSGRERVAVTPQSITIENAGLSFCMQWAYNVKFYQVNGPDRLVSERYDIMGKTERPSSKGQLRMMMQGLLADRFNLRFHRETRTVPVYELVVVSNTKLRPAEPDEKSGVSVVSGSFVFHRVSMPEFAEHLSDLAAIDRPVLDKTGREGLFDITLESAAITMRNDPDSIFSSIEGAGLRLNSRKGPLELLVVDHAEKPSGN
jgi:uncharacterized protein (TIGR03435 family)